MADNFDNDNDPHYRNGTSAGFKGNSNETRQNSAAGAHRANKTLGARQRQVLDVITSFGPAGAIPEEVAEALDLQLLVVRPRCGELEKLGKLYKAGRRPGWSGQRVTCYTAFKPADEAA